MNYLVKRLYFVIVFCVMMLCGCGYNGEKKENEVLMQLGSDEEVMESDSSVEVQENKSTKEIFVYVCGAVNKEGVYSVPEKSRLFEVVEKAGGFADDADRTSLNLAREVVDGEQITILTIEEAAIFEEAQQQIIKDKGLVNINTATASELTTISGIGESRAQAIIAYRETNGKFMTIDDIKKVDGIKDGLFSKIKDKITV